MGLIFFIGLVWFVGLVFFTIMTFRFYHREKLECLSLKTSFEQVTCMGMKFAKVLSNFLHTSVLL